MVAVWRKVNNGCMIPVKVARYNRGQQSGRMSVRVSMDSHQSQRTHILIAKVYQPLKQSITMHAPRGIDWQEKTIARPRLPLMRKTIKRAPQATNLSQNFYHTCMLRDLQTSTQVFINFTTTQLARLWYYYLHISKQSSSIKLLLVFNTLVRKFYY